MKLYYHDHFVLPLPEGHRFPMEKYARLRERLVNDPHFSPIEFLVPEQATLDELCLAHDPLYVERFLEGNMSEKEMRRIGFPWTPQLVERARRSVGGTIAACRAALQEGASANLAGGTHHAYAEHGEGYCVFNDSAVAARVMQVEGLTRRIAILDCDVHQGNGTAAILAKDPSVFTFSIHGEKNFPFHKEQSDLDIALPDGTGDDPYLASSGGGRAPDAGASQSRPGNLPGRRRSIHGRPVGEAGAEQERAAGARYPGYAPVPDERATSGGCDGRRLRPAGGGHRRYTLPDDQHTRQPVRLR